MVILKPLLDFIKILNAETSPRRIAAGLALGSIQGLTPALNLHNLIILFLIFMVAVDFKSAMLSWGVFKIFSYLLDPLFNHLGYFLLTRESFHGMWTALYNTPLAPWTRFNNTLVLGSFVFSLLLFWPLYFFLVWAVKKYRERIKAAVNKWKIVQALKATKIFMTIQRFL